MAVFWELPGEMKEILHRAVLPGSSPTMCWDSYLIYFLLMQKKKKYSYEVDLTSFHSFIYSSQIIMALLGTVDTKMSKAELFSPENL